MSTYAQSVEESLQRWKGKVAVVTGASSGIGKAVSEALICEGIHVVGLARRKDRLDAIADELKDQQAKFYPIQTDLTKETEIQKAFDWIKENLGPIHILINNVGIFQLGTILEGEYSNWKQIMDTNVLSYCICTKLAVQNMNDHDIQDGYVINMSSISGHMVPFRPGINVYPSTKHGIRALTEVTRHELKAKDSKIKVGSISPGLVETEIFSSTGIEKDIYATGSLNPKDVADVVLYILSNPPHVEIYDIIIRKLGEQL